jgi:uncharacterized protein
MKNQINDINQEEIERLDDYLNILSTPDYEMSVDKLDGLLHAVAIGPTTLTPNQWLPCIWGGNVKFPEMLSQTKTIDMMGLIFKRYNYIISGFEQPTPFINPIYTEVEYRNKEYSDPLCWVWGFRKGVELTKNDWKPLLESEIGNKWFEPIHLFTSQEVLEKEFEKVKTPVRRSKFCEKIENSILNIHQYWLPLRTQIHLKATEKAKQQKVGRNEPCSCGSGQKYKRCCGKND